MKAGNAAEKKNIKTAAVICAVVLYIAALILIPIFSTEYQLFYVEEKLTEWPGNGGLAYSAGDTIYLDNSHKEATNFRKGNGWGDREDGFSWSVGTLSELYFSFTEARDYILVIEVGEKMCSDYEVYANDYLLGNSQTEIGGKIVLELPQNVLEDSALVDLNFHINNPVRPCDISSSTDERELGFQLKSVCFLENTAENFAQAYVCEENPNIDYSLGNTVYFGSSLCDENSYRRGTGWHDRESEFCWTSGENAYVYFAIDENQLNTALNLTFSVPHIMCDSFDVSVNGEVILAGTDSAGEYTVEIPAEINNKQIITVDFVCCGAKSPSSVDGSSDERVLGIAVESLRIYNVKKEKVIK